MPTVDPRSFLAAVDKPARYIDHEINALRKPIVSGQINFCLAFPDAYEVGISHLGLKILYRILNHLPFAACDRVYAPWPDMNAALRESEAPLFGLESGVPLREFDVVGFTLQSELTYTNILDMLDLARIPLHREERGEADPIVIAGGPCACNPEPMAAFFDAILIGEGEEAIADLARVLHELQGKSRNDKLAAVATIPGYYVPAVHDPTKDRITARRYMDFGTAHDHYREQLIPWLQATHDRYGTEIMRGCSRGCRFCQAGFFYRPVRERAPEVILSELTDEVNRFGWEEVALVSLSSSDYSCILPVMRNILTGLDNTLLSLPSLRVDSLNDEIVGLLREIGQTGLTIAPEAGTQRLRDIINKNLTEDDILKGVELAMRNGWRLIKLYFMLGLPGETQEDVDGIVELIERIQQFTKRRLQIHITLSPFVPKPHTPFQWAAMDDRETLRAKIQSIRSRLFKYKNLKIRYHSLENSLLEAIISRGDRSVSQLIEAAWKNGARFDGWTEWFKVDVWENAWTELNLAGSVSERDINAPLPWNHVDLGVDTAFLRSEWDKAKLAATTPDCREAGCTGCGICNGDIRMTFATADNLPATQTIAEPDSKDAVPYRIHYRKGAGLAFVSHLDLMRNVMRLFRASGLPVAHTQGFKPHARISLSPPLSVGVEGWNEFIDVMLTRQVPPVEIERKLYLPSGMMLLGIDEWISKEDRDLSLYKYEGVAFLPSDAMKPAFADGFRRFTEAAEWPFERERKGKLHQSDLKELVARMDWDGDCLFIVKTLQGVSVFDILETIFGIARKRSGECRIVRTALAATIKELKPVKPE